MTRNERKLISLSQKRARMIERIRKAGAEHKGTRDLQARLVEATREQIKTEMRVEKQKGAA